MVYIVNDCRKVISCRSGNNNFFSACIDVSGLKPGEYRLYVCVQNGERTGLAPLDEQAEDFTVGGAQAE